MNIVGISGYARSGKDLFASVAEKILKERGLRVKKFALAYELKNDLKSLIKTKVGVDVFTENTDEKNIIRPLLVAYGDVMRKVSEGRYWTRKLEQKIVNSKIDVAIITDIRYDYYAEDEVTWLRNKQCGKLIHITKFKMASAPSKRRISTSKPVKIYDNPPNDHELLNNPKLKAKADYAFEWEDYSDKLNDIKLEDHPYINEHVFNALKNINVI